MSATAGRGKWVLATAVVVVASILLFARPLKASAPGLGSLLSIGSLRATAVDKPHSNIFISYGSGRFAASRDRLLREATATRAFHTVRGFSRSDLDPEFVATAKQVLDVARGDGYWVWKPYILLKTLEAAEDGDVVMYADAGCTFVGDPTPYLQLAREYGWLLFRLTHRIDMWTKGDLFLATNMSMQLWGSQRQLVGGIFAVRNSPENRQIAKQWMQLGSQYQLISDSPSVHPNAPNFKENRHDQAIFSLLAYKQGLQMVLEDETWPQEIARVIYAGRLTSG